MRRPVLFLFILFISLFKSITSSDINYYEVLELKPTATQNDVKKGKNSHLIFTPPSDKLHTHTHKHPHPPPQTHTNNSLPSFSSSPPP
jgi:hypothetical protein